MAPAVLQVELHPDLVRKFKKLHWGRVERTVGTMWAREPAPLHLDEEDIKLVFEVCSHCRCCCLST